MMRCGPLLKGALVGMVVALAGAWAMPALAQAPPKNQTATQFYMDYRQAFDKATKIEDVLPYMAEKNKQQAMETPKEDRDKMFEFMKMMGAVTDLKVVKEDRQPDGSAVLTCEGTGPDNKKTTGKVTIVKEKGAWKLGNESWSS